MALREGIVNCPAVGGILAAHAVRSEVAGLRQAGADWSDRPRRFASRSH